jgi:hypothetical protein
METLLGVRQLIRRGDSTFNIDLHDGFYALWIAPKLRDHFKVNVRGHLYHLACLPMGWSLSPFNFLSSPRLSFAMLDQKI